jgi:hypothetical protein
MNIFKLKQKELFENNFLPLLNGDSIKIEDIQTILSIRDEFEPKYLDEFIWKYSEKNPLDYKKIFNNILDFIQKYLASKDIKPFKYVRDCGGYGLQTFYVFAELKKGKTSKAVRYLSWCQNYIRHGKTSGILHDSNAPENLITLFGIEEHSFMDNVEEDYIQWGFSCISYYTFNLLNIDIDTHIKQGSYNYYVNSLNVSTIKRPNPKKIGMKDKNGVELFEFDTVRVKLKNENEIITTLNFGKGFGNKPMVSIPSSKQMGLHYNLLDCKKDLEWIEIYEELNVVRKKKINKLNEI